MTQTQTLEPPTRPQRPSRCAMRDYDWADIVEQLDGSSLEISADGDRVSFYKHPFGRCVVHENGGEVNVDFGSAPGLPGEVVAIVPGHTPALRRRVCIASFRLPFSIAYWSNACSAGHIDETTFAYRLRQALNGLPIDYTWGADGALP